MIRFESLLAVLLIAIKCSEADLANETQLIRKEDSNTNDSSFGHVFFRKIHGAPNQPGSRRVFGGSAANLEEFPAVCALIDRYYSVHCSGTVIASHWALTAAHCVNPRLAYVKYNTRQPTSSTVGSIAKIDILYQHPGYKVVQVSRSGGTDVNVLHNDVGLVRTKDEMNLGDPPTMLNNLHRYNSFDLYNREVQVLGFGRTERLVTGEELFGVRLQLVGCGGRDWVYCVCGHAGGADPRGVCSGDSGGPVVYQGVLVGVTSMGPLECAHPEETSRVGLTSVFTSLYQYSDLINNTVLAKESKIRMRKISLASPTHISSKLFILAIFTLFSAY